MDTLTPPPGTPDSSVSKLQPTKKMLFVKLLVLGIVIVMLSVGYGIRLHSINPEAFELQGSSGAGDNFIVGLLGLSIGIIVSITSILKLAHVQRDVFRQTVFLLVLFFAELIFNFGSGSIIVEFSIILNGIIVFSLYRLNKKIGNKAANRALIYTGALLALIFAQIFFMGPLI